MKKVLLLAIAGMFLLAGCVVSNETAEAIAQKSLGVGGVILFNEHVNIGDYSVFTDHIFIGKTGEGDFAYIRIRGQKIIVRERISTQPETVK